MAGGSVGMAERSPSIWIVGPLFDLTFFVGTALVVLLPWIAVEHYGVRAGLVLAAVAVASNGPHLVSTWTRVYLDGNERFTRPVAYWVVPALIAAFVVTMVVIEGRRSPLLRTMLLYWAWYHFLKQNWGILRIYQRKSGEVGRSIAHLERALLWLGAGWPLLHRIYTGPHRLFGAEIYHPTLAPWLVNGVGAALVVAATVYVLWRLNMVRRGQRVDLVRPLFLLSSWFGFFVPFVLIKQSGSAAFAAAACWHGLQYLAIVWVFNRNKWSDGIDPNARLVSWMSQPRRGGWFVYFATLLAIAGAFYAGIHVAALFAWDPKTWGALVWLSLTFGHYFLDGIIWKLRKPELARHLV